MSMRKKKPASQSEYVPTPEQLQARIDRHNGREAAGNFLSKQVQVTTAVYYLSNIVELEYDLPDFQRGYVWTKTQAIAFMERFRRGMPMGAILIWHPSHLRRPLLLDGQQRMVSLGAKVYRNGERVTGHTVHIDPENRCFTCTPSAKTMPLAEVVKGDFVYRLDYDDPLPFNKTEYGFLSGCSEQLRSMNVVALHLGGWWSPGRVDKATALDFFRCYNSGGTPILEEDLPPLKEKP